MEDYQGNEIQKGIWEVLQLWCVVKSAHLQSVSLCMFLSSEFWENILIYILHWYSFGETSLLDIGSGYDGWVRWGRWYGPWRKARTWAISILIILSGNAVYKQHEQGYKMQVHIEAHLLCKWSVKIRWNCWLRCHVYMISKPLIHKYIHVCHTDNWNTHTCNHQSTESPQNTQTHTVHWNTQTSQPIETPKLLRQLIHPNRPAQGSTQTAQFTEIPWSNPLKHTTHLVHWNTLLLHRPLGFYSM